MYEPKEYSGKESNIALNRLSKSLHEAILNECSSFVKSDLITVFYNLFDESCYKIILQEHYLRNDVSEIRRIEKEPTIFNYLLEVSILSSETEHKKITESEIISLIKSAALVTQACVHSDYLHRNDFEGGFRLFNNGQIEFFSNSHSEEVEKDLFQKMSLLSDKLRPNVSNLKLDRSGNIERVSATKEALFYDKDFYKKYNVNLSTVIGVAESIMFDIGTKEYGVEIFSQNYLLKKIKKYTSYDKLDIKKALELLSINQQILSSGYQFYHLFEKPVSVSIRPIIHLFEGFGEKGNLVYVGRSALFRATRLLFTYIDKGIIPVGDLAERWKQEKGPEFEKKLRMALSTRGFRVIRVTDPPNDVGEIDAVACFEKKQILLVVEAKAPKFDLSMEKEKLHSIRYREWCERHDKKMRWAKDNVLLLLSRLNLPKMEIKEIKGVIVTKVPWYSKSDLPYKIFSFEEFESLLDKIIKN